MRLLSPCLVVRAATARGQLSLTTSSTKKRKLAQPLNEKVEDSKYKEVITSHSRRGSSQLSSVSSPRHPGSSDAPRSSPPRYLPPHLHDEVLEASLSAPPTPDYSSTAASSPSAAYAGLSLEADEGGEMSTTDNEGGPTVDRLTQTGQVVHQPSGVTLSSQDSQYSVMMGGGITSPPERSSSPAIKRPASVLNDEDQARHDADVDMVILPFEGAKHEFETKSASTSPLSTELLQSDVRRQKRSTSIDMLGNEPYASTKAGSSTSGLSENTSTPASDSISGSSTINTSVQASVSDGSPKDIPSIDEQIGMVTGLVQQQLQDGQKGYVVSNKWLQRVVARSSNKSKDEKVDKEAMEGDIGPVDNSDLVEEGWASPSPAETVESRLPFLFPRADTPVVGKTDMGTSGLTDEAGEPFIPMKPLQISEDFEILPKEAWDLIIKWYGLAERSPVITRYAHNTNTEGVSENVQYEITPPIFTILKLRNDSEGFTNQSLREGQAKPIRILVSRSEKFQNFLKKVKGLAGIDMQTKVRLWRILGGIGDNMQAGIMTPLASRSASPAPNAAALKDAEKKFLLDLNAFLSLLEGSQRESIELEDQTANTKYNGHMNLATAGLGRDETLVIEEQIGGPGGGEWVSDAAGRAASKNGILVSVTKNGSTQVHNKNLRPKTGYGSGRTSPAPASGAMMTRGREKKHGRHVGTCGLSNMGNTCYMNSALQCVRSVEELTRYFLADEHKKELNVSNPLSHNGEVAQAYGTLLHQMLAPSAPASITPRNFKNTVGKYGPAFSGYGQQDSQEFLGFLLDGLQEDLNRILKKPYIEKPDSTDEMVNDPAALKVLADKCWDIYKARNDSVIVDLFAGTYKSTLVCPVCEKVSITFDPFSTLTLQLPIETPWTKEVLYFPLHGHPIKITVEMDKHGSIKDLKQFIASKMKVDPKRITGGEIFKHKFYKVYVDTDIVSDHIGFNDEAAFYELEDTPTNIPTTSKATKKIRSMLDFSRDDPVMARDSQMAERLLVPVFNRLTKADRWGSRHLFAVPIYIIVTREEADDYDTILKKVLDKVKDLTTLDIFKDFDNSEENSNSGDSANQTDSDMVFTTDEDSSGGAKVHDESVNGDDELVDVRMVDASSETEDVAQTQEPAKNRKKSARSKILEPGAFIPPALRNLFEMKIFGPTDDLVPTGWQNLSDSNAYESLSSRICRRSLTPPADASMDSFNMSSDRSPEISDEDLEDPIGQPNNYNLPVGANGDSESEEDLPSVNDMLSQGRYLKPGSRSTLSNKAGNYRGKGKKKTSKLTTYSKKGKQVSKELASDSEEESGDNRMADGGPIIRLGEGIILDWNAHGYEALFGAKSQADELRGRPTWEYPYSLPDPTLKARREFRERRKREGISLEECLDEFSKSEVLSENDPWYCPRCKEHRRATKTFELWKSPDILVIHLKRFSANRTFRDKIDVLVDFPIEGLDLNERVTLKEEGKDSIYDLFAVDNHYGGLGGGHYTAIAKNFIDGDWYDYNDSSVSRRNPQSAVTNAAYLLFYRRRSDRPLGGPLFEKICDEQTRESDSQSSSRAESPAGDDRRLGDFSRNGSSSAFQGREASHQEVDGFGRTNPAAASELDNPPAYPGYGTGQELVVSGTQLEDVDEQMDDDGIEQNYPYHSEYVIGNRINPFSGAATWGFQNITTHYGNDDLYSTELQAPPGSDEGDPDDNASHRAAGGFDSGSEDLNERMRQFDDDEGFNGGDLFDSTPRREPQTLFSLTDSPPRDHPSAFEADDLTVDAPMDVGGGVGLDDEDDAPAVDIHVEEGEQIVV